ncbi:MAG: ABC transporter ATP-binding protein [Dethiobacteria bacterium]|nr:ABC transporter ATP-binding protein [Bacillota bacterium]MDW7728513.1 ABC transporter ATP-binding protein [Bacillota bacterium]
MLLEVKNLTVSYDTAMILNDVSVSVDKGELVSLVGPNGAGKSTFIRTITGLVRWERETLKGTRYGDITIEGTVRFNGEYIEKLPAHDIVNKGLSHCPERRRPFTEMSVYENLMAGAYLITDKKEMHNNLEAVYSIFPILKERSKQISGTLSGGEQQMLAIGRSLMVKPMLLCIDEPSTGLAPQIKQQVFDKIKEIQASGMTILLVEQDVSMTFAMADRNYILSHGKIVTEGTSAELLKDETVRQSYLGL